MKSASALAFAGALGLACAAVFPAGCAETPPSTIRTALRVATTATTAPAEPDAGPPPEPPKSQRFAVASENANASRVALDVLEKGGSAVDAAIAGVLAIGVTQPVSSGLGGGGFAMVWDAKTKTVTLLDFRETAPIGLHAADFASRPPPEKKRGVMIGVPGEVTGLVELHKRFGKLAFADDVRPAAELAEHGFPVSPHLSRILSWMKAWVLATPRYAFFTSNGTLVSSGVSVKNPALATTLRKLAAEGKAAFYEGAIAKDVLATARSVGSAMTGNELRAYALVERTPLRTKWEEYDVFTMPPPSGGGLLVLETLRMHKRAELAALGFGSGAYTHLLAETFRGAIADRVRTIGDPAFVKVDADALASPARMQARRARISMTATTPPEKFTLAENGTSHLVAVDAEGNVVSITSTVNNPFGARVVTESGFVLNDQLDDFTTESIEKRFGLARGPNSPRGGARPASSMTPTLVVRDGAPVFALGGSGGMRIPTSVAQVLLANLVFNRGVSQAVADLRFETPAAGGLFLDASTPPAIVEDLKSRGEVVEMTKLNLSAVQAVSIGTRDGVRSLEAGADPRKGGVGLTE